MTDRELLELAAKAAGMVHMKYAGGSGLSRMLDPSRPETTGSIGPCWNPLNDDGAALRLAVELNIEFACFDDEQQTNAGVWSPDSEPYNCMTSYNGNKQAAVRRAIVRAAAAIQQAKEAQ